MEINEMQEKFLKQQNEFRSRIKTEDDFDVNEIRLIAGVDLAYWKDENNEETAVCCIVVIDYNTHQIVEKKHYSGKIEVPYMPNVIKLRKRKKVTGTVKVSVTFIMKIFMNRM